VNTALDIGGSVEGSLLREHSCAALAASDLMGAGIDGRSVEVMPLLLSEVMPLLLSEMMSLLLSEVMPLLLVFESMPQLFPPVQQWACHAKMQEDRAVGEAKMQRGPQYQEATQYDSHRPITHALVHHHHDASSSTRRWKPS
jgi:hypothetical protein